MQSAKTLSLSEDLLSFPKFYYFIFLVLFSCGFSFYVNEFYATETLFINSYGGQLSVDRIQRMFENGKKLAFIGYIFIPISFLIRVSYNTAFISIGNFFNEEKFRLSQTFNLCLKAKIVFIFTLIARIIFIEFFLEVNTLNDLNTIPLSLYQILNDPQLPKWSVQTLLYINVFEVAYIVVLSLLLGVYNNMSFSKNVVLVILTYGVGLFLWCLLLTYLTLLFS